MNPQRVRPAACLFTAAYSSMYRERNYIICLCRCKRFVFLHAQARHTQSASTCSCVWCCPSLVYRQRGVFIGAGFVRAYSTYTTHRLVSRGRLRRLPSYAPEKAANVSHIHPLFTLGHDLFFSYTLDVTLYKKGRTWFLPFVVSCLCRLEP